MSEEARTQEPQVAEQEAPQTVDEVNPFEVFPEVDQVIGQGNSDPFAELMQSDPQEMEAPIEPEVTEQPETDSAVDAEPKEDQNQYQYWQSQADKRSKELGNVLTHFGVESIDELQAKYGDIQDIAPIARYVKSNPHVLDGVEASLSNGAPQSQTQAGDSEPTLKQPEKPTKPSNYDAIDAYSDPSTDSFKYREALESYRDDMLEYSRSENDLLRDQMAREKELQEQRLEAARYRENLVNNYGMEPEEADRFMTYMASPDSYSVDNLVTLWRNQQGTPAPQEAPAPQETADPTAEAMKRQREKLSMPQPVSVAPGSGEGADKPVERVVMDAMISDYKKQNPW